MEEIKYYKYLVPYIKSAKDLEVGKIYPSSMMLGCISIAVYVENCLYFGYGNMWKEVTENDYLNQIEQTKL